MSRMYDLNREASGGVDVVAETLAAHVGSGGSSHTEATASASGFFSSTDKNRLDRSIDVYDLTGGSNNKPSVNGFLLNLIAVRNFTLPISLAGSFAKAQTSSSGVASFTIAKNGSSIGTLVFNSSATGTFTLTAAVSFVPGDVLTIKAPAVQDATLSDVAVTLRAGLH